MNKDIPIDKIHRYLTGRMSHDEMQAFEKEIEENEELKKKVNSVEMERQIVSTLVKKEYEKRIKDSLVFSDDIINETESKIKTATFDSHNDTNQTIIKDKKTNNFRIQKLNYRIAIAASFLLLLSISGYFWLASQYSNEGLIATYYINPEKDLSNDLRGVNMPNVNIEAYSQAKRAYENTEYKDAAKLFEDISEGNEQATYFLAQSQFNDQDYASALENFRKVFDMDGRFKEKASYYQVLSYIGNNQLEDEFYNLLNSMASDNTHSYHNEAKQIQKKIDGFWRVFFE